MLIGGAFDMVNGVSRNRLARLNADGTLDTGFHPDLAGLGDAYPRRYAIAVQADGKVLIAGGLKAVDGVSRTNIARLNADGTLDSHFHPSLAGINPWVNTVAAQGDGKVLIAGAFTTVDGVSRTNIARLNANGTLDTGFQAAISGGGSSIGVRLVAVQRDGKVLIWGEFTTINDVNRFTIARLNSDGTLDTGFQTAVSSGSPRPGVVASVAMQSDGKMLIGGEFDMVNGVSRNSLARLNRRREPGQRF